MIDHQEISKRIRQSLKEIAASIPNQSEDFYQKVKDSDKIEIAVRKDGRVTFKFTVNHLVSTYYLAPTDKIMARQIVG